MSPAAREHRKHPAPTVNPILATWPLLLGMGILMLGAGLQSTLLGVRATIGTIAAEISAETSMKGSGDCGLESSSRNCAPPRPTYSTSM